MQYGIFKMLSRVVCLLPHAALLWLGKVLGDLYYLFVSKQRRRAIAQMRRGLGISEAEAARITKESFRNIGRSFLEILYMPRLHRGNFEHYIEIEHLDRLEAALAEKHGVVVLTGHVGNWEWLAAGLSFVGLPVTTIVKRQPNDQHTKLLNEYREMVGVEVFSRGTTELVGAAKALKKGKLLGFLADQDAGMHGVFVDFLGAPASTPLGPAVFSKRFHSPVVPAFIVRKPDGKHKILIMEALRYEDTGDEERNMKELTVKMTRVLEAVIRAHPDNWLWFQKRWNTTPEEFARHAAEKARVRHE